MAGVTSMPSHSVWLKQLEHSCVTKAGEYAKLKFWRVLMWHQPAASHKAVTALTPVQKKQTREKLSFNVPAKLGLEPRSVVEWGSASYIVFVTLAMYQQLSLSADVVSCSPRM